MVEMAKHYGYSHYGTFETVVSRQYDIHRQRQFPDAKTKAEPLPRKVILPPVKLIKYKPAARRGSPETQVLLLSDHHDGESTASYNHEICAERTNRIFTSAMTITELHRKMYDVDHLKIFMLGDMVHGENPRQGAKPGTISQGALTQVLQSLPRLNKLLASFRENFKTVEVWGVPGNHGRISKDAPETSNWDIALYNYLATERLPAGIVAHPPSEWYQLVDIDGFRFFLAHMDQVRMTNGIPYFAMVRKIQSWYITLGGFSYSCGGHTHLDYALRINAKTVHFNCGPLVTDDNWALGAVGTSTIPSQTTFFVHHKYGVTGRYSLVLDDKFLPDRKQTAIAPPYGG